MVAVKVTESPALAVVVEEVTLSRPVTAIVGVNLISASPLVAAAAPAP
jgi:hypothetical protein